MNPLSETLTKLRVSVAKRGLVGTMGFCRSKLFGFFSQSYRQARREARMVDREFDRKYGIDTGGLFTPGLRDASTQNWRQGNRYEAIHPETFLKALHGLRIEHQQFTFIDFGSGKGRALLLAAGFPFRRVIGVEYVEKLNIIARQNVSRWRNITNNQNEIEIIGMDACQFPIPEGPLLIYFYNPFTGAILEKVIDNLTKSYQENPRPMIVLCFSPNHAGLFERVAFLKRDRNINIFAIYDSQVGTLPAVKV